MKQWMGWMLMLGLAACDPGGPNGKKEILFFEAKRYGPLAEGFSETLTLPRQTSLGGGGKSVTRRESFSFDFADTTLAVSTAPGLTVEKTWLDDVGHHITYRCEPAEKSQREVRVQVLGPEGKERYADAFDVQCGRPLALKVEVRNSEIGPQPQGPMRKFMLGADVMVLVTLQGRTDMSDASELIGGVVSLVDPEGLVRPRPVQAADPSRQLLLETARAGRSPRVSLAGLESVIPLEVVEDSSFQLQMKPSYSPATGQAPGLWTIRAEARHTDGSLVEGLSDCVLEIRPLSGAVITEERGGCYTHVKGDVGPGTACVRARGKSACGEYTR